jgi:hypothetical protein
VPALPGSRFSPAPNVLTRPVGGELVLLNLDTELYFGLDPVGAAMWQALTAHGTVAGAVEVLTPVYDADAEQLRGDLEELVEELVKRELLLVDDD